MTRWFPPFVADTCGSAAAEMALVLPMLMALFFGGFEGGYFIWREHETVIAAREGARFAGRLSLDQFDCGTGAVTTDASTLVRTLVQAKLGGEADVDVSLSCLDDPDNVKGIYVDEPNGAPIVTVSVSRNYDSLFSTLGFNTSGLTLGASAEAAVMGL